MHIALVAANKIAAGYRINALRSVDDGKIGWGFRGSENRSAAVARTRGMAPASCGTGELLADPAVQPVWISSTSENRPAQPRRCMTAGKRVIRDAARHDAGSAPFLFGEVPVLVVAQSGVSAFGAGVEDAAWAMPSCHFPTAPFACPRQGSQGLQ